MGGRKDAACDLHLLTSNQIDRFWSAVDKSAGDDACWHWTRGRDKDGYGKVGFGKKGEQKHYRSHRVALFLASSSLGEVAMHATCDNPICCNPRHLKWGTQTENRADCVAKGRTARGETSGRRTKPERTARGERHPAATLTDAQAAELRRRYVRGLGGVLAREFGVSRNVAHAIGVGRSYRHLSVSAPVNDEQKERAA